MHSSRFALVGFLAGVFLSTSPGCGPASMSKTCDPAVCNGCCAESGDCLAGTSVFECGAAGAACAACAVNETCGAGACILFADGDYDASFPERMDASVRSDAGVYRPPDSGIPDAGLQGDGGRQDVSYSAQIQPLWDSKCSGCHMWNYDNIVNTANRVIPQNPAGSAMYTRTQSGDMPRGGAAPLTSTQLSLLRDWILNGAPEN